MLASFENIGTQMSNAESPLFANEETKKALIGLARDLRGLAFAFNSKTSYMMLFDWMYPSHDTLQINILLVVKCNVVEIFLFKPLINRSL